MMRKLSTDNSTRTMKKMKKTKMKMERETVQTTRMRIIKRDWEMGKRKMMTRMRTTRTVMLTMRQVRIWKEEIMTIPTFVDFPREPA